MFVSIDKMFLILFSISQAHLAIGLSLHNITKRFLIFPQAAPTRAQYIVGVGIPAELDVETVTVGFALKAQYYLPYNATQLRYSLTASGYPITRRSSKRNRKLSNPRLFAYRVLERILNGMGHDGLDCVLMAICEAAQIPFADDHVIAEVFHIFFTPSSSPAELRFKSIQRYLQAELAGSIGDPCHLQYPRCKLSIMKLISVVV